MSEFIRDTVESLLRQDWPGWEAVIVDDGSPDDIHAPIAGLLDSDSRLRYVSKPNGGVSSARNYGFRAVSKDASYVLFLDGDDLLASAALRRMVETLEKHPQAGMVHCDPSFVDENGKTVAGVLWSPRWAWGPRVLRADESVTPFESVYTLAGLIPSLTMIRRTLYEQTPGWDESFGQHCEDTDLFLHVALRSEVRYLPEKLLLHRRHSGQSTTDVSHFNKQEKKLYDKWTHMGGLTLAQREKIAKAEWFRTRSPGGKKGIRRGKTFTAEGRIQVCASIFCWSFSQKAQGCVCSNINPRFESRRRA